MFSCDSRARSSLRTFAFLRETLLAMICDAVDEIDDPEQEKYRPLVDHRDVKEMGGGFVAEVPPVDFEFGGVLSQVGSAGDTDAADQPQSSKLRPGMSAVIIVAEKSVGNNIHKKRRNDTAY